MLVAVSPQFFADIERLSSYPQFINTVQLSDKQVEERYDLELVTRFIVLHNWPSSKLTLNNLRDLPQILDDQAVAIASQYPVGMVEIEQVFKETFDVINNNGEDNIFRRWVDLRNEFRGPFLTSAFEIFALGIGYRIANNLLYRTDLVTAAQELWKTPKMKSGYYTGRSTESRLVEFIPLGRSITQ